MTPVGFNVLLLTKPLSQFSRRRWSEDDKEEEGQRMSGVKEFSPDKAVHASRGGGIGEAAWRAVGGKGDVSPKAS